MCQQGKPGEDLEVGQFGDVVGGEDEGFQVWDVGVEGGLDAGDAVAGE